MAKKKSFRKGDAVGPDYKCGQCGCHGFRLWRNTHTFLDGVGLMCATCAEVDQKEQIVRYADFHQPTDPTIGDLVPARVTPDGDTFWGHTSGDVEWWYALPQYPDAEREMTLLRRERNHFCLRYQHELAESLRLWREKQATERAAR